MKALTTLVCVLALAVVCSAADLKRHMADGGPADLRGLNMMSIADIKEGVTCLEEKPATNECSVHLRRCRGAFQKANESTSSHNELKLRTDMSSGGLRLIQAIHLRCTGKKDQAKLALVAAKNFLEAVPPERSDDTLERMLKLVNHEVSKV